jgi:hypothetical protein
MHKYLIYILVIAHLGSNAQGFRSRYYLPNAKTNETKAIFESTPSNYIAGGFIVDSAYTNRLCIMGLNSQGQLQWAKKYGSNKFMYLSNLLISRSFYKQGNYLYYTGAVYDSSSTNINKNAGVLIKFDLNGDTVWQKVYRDVDTLEDVIPQMITASADGGFLITGWFQNWSNTPYGKCLLIKTDANGNELWRKKVIKNSYPDVQDGKAIAQDSASKKIVIVGYQYIGGSSSYNNILILDSLGVKLSQQSWDGIGAGGYLLDLIQTKDKKFVAVGVNFYPQTIGGNNIRGSYIVKFDIDMPNIPIWKIYNFDKPTLGNIFNCISELPDGNLLVGGIIDTLQQYNINRNNFVRFARFTKNGVLIDKSYYDYKINAAGNDNNLSLTDLHLTHDGGWVAALQVVNFPSPNPFFFVKYDSMGCDSSLTYCQSVAAGENELEIKSDRLKIYPNPSSGLLHLELTSKNLNNYKLKLTNVLGADEVFVDTGKQNDVLRIDINHLKNGIYFLQVLDEGKLIHTEKIIKE